MNTKELARVKTSGRQDRGDGDDERGVKPARDRDLPLCSGEILRDLGLVEKEVGLPPLVTIYIPKAGVKTPFFGRRWRI